MRHQDLTINHILESWTYANAADRTSATGFVAGDVGRIAYQQDTGEYWRLTATTPTWARIITSIFASLQTVATTPATITSLTGVMMGLSGIITPAVTGKIMVTICGAARNDTAASGVTIRIHYGAGGTGPANGAAPSGTAIGGIGYINSAIANARCSFSVSAIISGLTIGSPSWLDIAGTVVTSGIVTFSNVAISACELP